ncbi:hypothetical protein GOB27_19455 [Sinorhizobium meliloti]|nr:hypothetical protein [Sinorhizobium meliloti]
MTSCIASACPVDTDLDVDAVYFALSRCGLDEESFNALFQYMALVAAGTGVVRAYASYCAELRQENVVRELLNRRRLAVVTLTTMLDLVEEYLAAVHIARFAELPDLDAATMSEAIDRVFGHGRAPSRTGLDTGVVPGDLRAGRLASIIMGGAA